MGPFTEDVVYVQCPVQGSCRGKSRTGFNTSTWMSVLTLYLLLVPEEH